jgi:hypothetical protein
MGFCFQLNRSSYRYGLYFRFQRNGRYQNLSATNNKITNIAGSTTPISLTAGGPTCGFGVWVDWNNNLTFETSERVFVTNDYITSTSDLLPYLREQRQEIIE